MDPFAALGVRRGAPPEEVTAAYRRAAKRWHPDRVGDARSAARMAEINAAYAALRGPAKAPSPARPERNRLGPELAAALAPAERVLRVAAASTWASPRTLLVLTDRRLLWLLQDAVAGRVAALRFADVAEVVVHRGRLRRGRAVLGLRTRAGRRLRFGELPPSLAHELAAEVRARAAAVASGR